MSPHVLTAGLLSHNRCIWSNRFKDVEERGFLDAVACLVPDLRAGRMHLDCWAITNARSPVLRAVLL
jgi:hypothetical protein